MADPSHDAPPSDKTQTGHENGYSNTDSSSVSNENINICKYLVLCAVFRQNNVVIMKNTRIDPTLLSNRNSRLKAFKLGFPA